MYIILSIEITHLNINNFLFISGVLVIITEISNKTSTPIVFYYCNKGGYENDVLTFKSEISICQ